MSEPIIGPLEMGKQLLEVFGLSGVRGITKIAVSMEGDGMPKLHIERTITKKEAGVFCAVLRSWECEILAGKYVERRLTGPRSADGGNLPPSQVSHPAAD